MTTSSWSLDEKGVVAACAQCGAKNRIPYERLTESGQCGQCHQALALPNVPLDVPTEAIWQQLTQRTALPILVDFWAPWCGPCRMVAPEMAKVAAANPSALLVVKVNTEALPNLGQRYQVHSIPTMALFRGGREIARSTGARPAAEIEQFVRGAP